MTKEQFEREKNYRSAMSLAKSLRNQKVISEEDYQKVDAFMMAKFQPILSGLCP